MTWALCSPEATWKTESLGIVSAFSKAGYRRPQRGQLTGPTPRRWPITLDATERTLARRAPMTTRERPRTSSGAHKQKGFQPKSHPMERSESMTRRTTSSVRITRAEQQRRSTSPTQRSINFRRTSTIGTSNPERHHGNRRIKSTLSSLRLRLGLYSVERRVRC